MAGLQLDPWQAWLMEQAAAYGSETYFNDYTGRRERKWAAFEFGLMVSRQNGKGSLLEARELAGLFLWGERLIIHSAHQFDTSKEAFERILMLIEGCDELRREVARVSRSHGEEGVELKNGQRLRFRTRTKGGGRGFTADCIILDEAMYLTESQVNALMPTLSSRPNAQVWLTGSAGDKDSVAFGRMRNRALRAGVEDPGRMVWAEWSIEACTVFCPPGCTEHDDPDDIHSWAKANPALGIRISEEYIVGERRSMSHEGFLQERLGVGDWPTEGEQWAVIPEDAWKARGAEEGHSVMLDPVVLAVDTTPDRSYSSISAAGRNEHGQRQVELLKTADGTGYEHRSGTQWVVPRVLDVWTRHRPWAVVIDRASWAGAFIDELVAKGVNVITPNAREYAQACGEFYSAAVPRENNVPDLVHLNQEPLNNAVAGADKRLLADMWAWDKKTSSVDISPLVSCTNAMWGLQKMEHDNSKPADPWVAWV